MIHVAAPTAAPRSGMRWMRCEEYCVEETRHVVTAGEVRLAIVYGGRMKTAGQVIVYRHAVTHEYYVEVPR